MNGEAISLEALLGLPTASWSPAGSLHHQQQHHLALGGAASCCGSLVDPVPTSWQATQQQTYASLVDNNQQHYSAASLVDDPLGISSSLGEVYGGMSSCHQPPHPISQEWPSLAQCHTTLALDGERQAQEAMLALQALQQQQEIMLLQRHINSLTPLQAHQLLAHVHGPSSLDLPLHSSEGLVTACGTDGMALPARSLSATTLAAGGMNAAMSASVRLASAAPFARLSASQAAPTMLAVQQQQQQQAAMQQHQVQQQQQQQRRLMQQASVGPHRHGVPASPASSSSLPTGLTAIAGATAVTQTGANNRPAGHPGRVPRSTSSLGRSHRHRKDAQPVTPKAPTWAGADWHPLKAVLASGQAAMAGTGVFLPHLSGLSSGSDVAASEPPSLLSFSDLESSTAFSALDSMDHALLTNSMSDMSGMFPGTPERPGMPSPCHADYTAAVM